MSKKLTCETLQLKLARGFTVVDLVVVMATIAVLMGLVSVNLIAVQDKAHLNTTMNTLISDLRTQQLKAMVGDTEGRENPERYGIHFDNNSYTLFHGSVYEPEESSNILVELPEKVTFENINFPFSQVIFETGSGEFVGYSDSQNSLQLVNSSSDEVMPVELNRYGVITLGP